MKRTGTGPSQRIANLIAGIATFILAACVTSPVSVDAGDATSLSRSATIHVALAPRPEAAAATTEGEIDRALDAAQESALRENAERALEAKGFAIGPASDSDLVFELAPRHRQTARRTWSSDPDASAVQVVKKSEAVLGIRARTQSEGVEVWRCDARARLPESNRGLGESADEVWARVLSRALAPIPEQR